MHVHTKIALFLLTAIACAAMGCKSESTPRSTLELTMETRNDREKLIVPEGSSLEISKYLVNGKGPDDDTFSVVSTKQTVSVSGLRIGSWQVTVDGLNASGSRLASGSATIQLQPEPTPQTIYLDTLEGSGAARITIQWDSSLIADPSLTLDLARQGENTTQRQVLDTSTLEGGYASWSSNSLEAGSYTLVGKLFAGGIQVSGFVEALRIVDGLTAEATVTMNLEKTTAIPATINLVNTIGEPILCTITGISEQMDASTEVRATIEPEPGSEVSLTWYQDGIQAGNGLTYRFTPSLGSHRLDVLASGSGKASLGSASFTYEGTLSGFRGVPVSMGKLVDTSGQLKAPAGSQLAFLPDGNLLVAGGGTIQICKLVRGKPVVVQNYSSSNAANWPLSHISDVAVDLDKSMVFIADNTGKCLWAFSYDRETKKLTYLRKSDNLTYAASSGDYTIKETGRLQIDSSRGLVYLSLTDDTNRVFSLAYREEPVNGQSFRVPLPLHFSTSSITASDGEQFVPLFWRTAISDDGNYIVALDEHNLLVWSNTIGRSSLGLNPLPVTLLCATSSYRAVKVRDIAILSPSSVVAASDGGVYLLCGDLSAQNSAAIANWKIRQANAEGQVKLTDGTTATFDGMEVLFMSEQNGMCYGLCTGSGSILSMAKGDDGSLLFKGATDLDGFPPGELALSPDGKTMVASSATENGLVLLQLP